MYHTRPRTLKHISSTHDYTPHHTTRAHVTSVFSPRADEEADETDPALNEKRQRRGSFFAVDLGDAEPEATRVHPVRRRSRFLSTVYDSNAGAIISLAIEPARTGIIGVVLERRVRPNGDAEVVITRLLPGLSAWLSDLVLVDDEVISIGGKPLADCSSLDEVRSVFAQANDVACVKGCDVIFVIRRISE